MNRLALPILQKEGSSQKQCLAPQLATLPCLGGEWGREGCSLLQPSCGIPGMKTSWELGCARAAHGWQPPSFGDQVLGVGGRVPCLDTQALKGAPPPKWLHQWVGCCWLSGSNAKSLTLGPSCLLTTVQGGLSSCFRAGPAQPGVSCCEPCFFPLLWQPLGPSSRQPLGFCITLEQGSLSRRETRTMTMCLLLGHAVPARSRQQYSGFMPRIAAAWHRVSVCLHTPGGVGIGLPSGTRWLRPCWPSGGRWE